MPKATFPIRVEPEVQPVRDSEALIIVLDTNATSIEVFQSLHDASVCIARTRLIYGISKDDLIGVIRSGSSITSNNLVKEVGGGYTGVHEVLRPVTRSLRAVKALLDSEPGTNVTNLFDVLDVSGDAFSTLAAKRARKYRVMLFTDGNFLDSKLDPSQIKEFEETCTLYKDNLIQVDVIYHCSEEIRDKLDDLSADFADSKEPNLQNLINECRDTELAMLFTITNATGGRVVSLEDALPLAEMPSPKPKAAFAKYRGVLNIANTIKIPVKRFSYVLEAKHPSGKKISWKASLKRNSPVSVMADTQRVASAKDDTPLQLEEIVKAYPYGPELVPEPNQADSSAWSMRLERGLDVLGFVPQDSVPYRLFLGQVDVVVPMPGLEPANMLMRSLVLALHSEKMGILARYVTSPRGGAPSLTYLWPSVESNEDADMLRKCYLFAVEVPMKDDIRQLPFASLELICKDISNDAEEAVEKFISAATLGSNGDKNESMEDDVDEEPFWPPDYYNPNLDWFNNCIVHRALSGVEEPAFPPLSRWHKEILDPMHFMEESKRSEVTRSIEDLPKFLPITKAPERVKKEYKLYAAITGNVQSIKSYLPAEDTEDFEAESDEEGISSSHMHVEMADVATQMTNLEIIEVGEETPEYDFSSLVKNGQFRFASATLITVIRRLIREGTDDGKALRCLQALRRTSISQEDPRFFNDFVASLLTRCNRNDSIGNRSVAFIRFVALQEKIPSALDIISLSGSPTGTNVAEDALSKEVASQMKAIASKGWKGHSMSMMSEH